MEGLFSRWLCEAEVGDASVKVGMADSEVRHIVGGVSRLAYVQPQSGYNGRHYSMAARSVASA